MTENELKIWFWNKYNSCYPIRYYDDIFMIYDKNFLRQRKLSRVLGTTLEYPTKVEGICLFKLDLKQHYFDCGWHEIWSVLKDNHDASYLFIKKLLNNTKQFKNYRPGQYHSEYENHSEYRK